LKLTVSSWVRFLYSSLKAFIKPVGNHLLCSEIIVTGNIATFLSLEDKPYRNVTFYFYII